MSPYLRLITTFGFTRHMGGLKATDYLLEHANLKEDQHVLDVGCGAGLSSAHIAKTYDVKVTGLDSSQNALKLAWETHKNEPYLAKLDFVAGDITSMPFADNTFDVVNCESVILFVDDKEAALKEMMRVLKPGGFISLNELVIDPHRNADEVVEYFRKEEMGAYLITPEAYRGIIAEINGKPTIWDEESFSLLSQIIADTQQFFNFKSVLLMLEMLHKTFTDSEVRRDMLLFLKFILEGPKDLAQSLMTIKTLIKKPAQRKVASSKANK